MRTLRLVAAVLAGVLALAASPVGPAQAASPSERVVRASPYRIPEALLTRQTGEGSFGYGHSPAYGFDTADHNVQCYVARSEDSTIYACGVQQRDWKKPTGLRCTSAKYVGVQGFAAAAYGGEGAGGTCSEIPIVPRERRPGSRAVSGKEVNRVLPAGSTLRVLGLMCGAAGSGRSATIRCTETRTGRGFTVSRRALTTF